MVFEHELNKLAIEWTISGDREIRLIGYKQDIAAIFTNLIDNSIYWISNTNENTLEIKSIKVDIVTADGVLKEISFKDSGPGIEENLI